jgi:hypothetical protein
MEVRRPFIGGTTREESIDVHNIFEESPFAFGFLFTVNAS